jgi:hypothetical protein
MHARRQYYSDRQTLEVMELVAPAVVGTAGDEHLSRALRGYASPQGVGSDDTGPGNHRDGDEHAHGELQAAPPIVDRASRMNGLHHQSSAATKAAQAKAAANVALVRAKVDRAVARVVSRVSDELVSGHKVESGDESAGRGSERRAFVTPVSASCEKLVLDNESHWHAELRGTTNLSAPNLPGRAAGAAPAARVAHLVRLGL